MSGAYNNTSIDSLRTGLEIIKLCPGSFLLRVAQADISWVFNPWPEITKFLDQRNLLLNGVVYPDLLMQQGRCCNLIEFPLFHAMYVQGMLFRNEKPQLVGTSTQLQQAAEQLRRGLYGFYDCSEMQNCDLDSNAQQQLMNEIRGLAWQNRIQAIDEFIELVTLPDLETNKNQGIPCQFRGLKIWKKNPNIFGLAWRNEEFEIDCNLTAEEVYQPPLKIDVKQIPYRSFQVIDTGEEDGFAEKSCMHTVIQWQDKIICIDLPMNARYLLDRVSLAANTIDAVIFTHNHDDHIGELSLLLNMDRKVTVISPRIVWKSILLKAASVFAMSIDELAGYFEYLPILFGPDNELNYHGLYIEAHPSIHSVPCAVYRFRAEIDGVWKDYSHLSDILNFRRCHTLIEQGFVDKQRFEQYREFLLRPAAIKKVDIGTPDGGEDWSVHGHWRDFCDDQSDHIVLAHIQGDKLNHTATVQVGQLAAVGTAQHLTPWCSKNNKQRYKQQARQFLLCYLSNLTAGSKHSTATTQKLISATVATLIDNDIVEINPNTPFIRTGEKPAFVDLVLSGLATIWGCQNEVWHKLADVQPGDIVGEIGVLKNIPRTASIRAETYLRVLRIPGAQFRTAMLQIGLYDSDAPNILEKIWQQRNIIQKSQLFSEQIPIHLQNHLAQYGSEQNIKNGEVLYKNGNATPALFLGNQTDAFILKTAKQELVTGVHQLAVFGEFGFITGSPEPYQVIAKQDTKVLKIGSEQFSWIRQIPLLKLRLRQLSEQRQSDLFHIKH